MLHVVTPRVRTSVAMAGGVRFPSEGAVHGHRAYCIASFMRDTDDPITLSFSASFMSWILVSTSNQSLPLRQPGAFHNKILGIHGITISDNPIRYRFTSSNFEGVH